MPRIPRSASCPAVPSKVGALRTPGKRLVDSLEGHQMEEMGNSLVFTGPFLYVNVLSL